MAISTRLTGVNKDFEVMLKEDLSPQARSAALASIARAGLAEAQETNRKALGRVPPHETVVDSRRGGDIDAVKPDGVIVFEFELLDDLFGWIDLQLIKHAPVLTGKFRRSFVLFADGVEIDPDGPLPQAREFSYVNVQPYARKIERGHSSQAPNGVFQVVAALANTRFGNMANIRFSYRTPIASKAGSAKARRKSDTANRQPAIVITLR
jgi:hypothetical protein